MSVVLCADILYFSMNLTFHLTCIVLLLSYLVWDILGVF